ncbi:G- coupled receptor Mth2, partial [Brachionus plicatilis]
QLLLPICMEKIGGFECKDSCDGSKSWSKNCYCDHCDLFGDCCQDMAKPVESTLFECNSKLSENQFIYTVGRCPSNFSDNSIRQKCEASTKKILDKTPVFSNQTGNYYKNIFCAKCNLLDLNLKELIFFSILAGRSSFLEPDYYDNTTIRQILNGTSSKAIVFKAPKGLNPRSCFKSIDSCPLNFTNQTLENLCKNHTAFRYHFGLVYKNKYCAMCNGVVKFDCIVIYSNKLFIQSLQILFDLSELNREVYLSMKVSKRQKKDTIFNQIEKIEEFANKSNKLCGPLDSYPSTEADLAKKYTTLAGHAISILSLVLLLTSYIKNKDLRNLPGKILMNLSISLLFSQLFFIISTYYTYSLFDITFDSLENKCQMPKLNNKFDDLKTLFMQMKLIIPCFISGVMTHYFYLVFFLWSNIMAFDLFKMFTKTAQSAPQNIQSDSKIFFKYLAMAWLVPVVLIIILLLKNYNKLSYGFNQCFISSNVDLLIFFVVPIVVVLSMNLVFLVVSIKAITVVDLLKKKYMKNPVPTISFSGLKLAQEHHSLKKRLVLFLKLFILTGMTWIIGLISAMINDKNSFLWYVYIVLNSLQGLFIFCAYSFNKNSKSNIKINMLKIFNCFKAKEKFSINPTSSIKQSAP